MIETLEIIEQPISGEFEELIFNNESSWNSDFWTWVEFTNSDGKIWCGQFRGKPKNVAISKHHGIALVLTSNCLYQLNIHTETVEKQEDTPIYTKLTVSPKGNFILADNYQIHKIESNISSVQIIESPIKMDFIEFIKWNDKKLEFKCDEFLNWERHLEMEFDSESETIRVKKEI